MVFYPISPSPVSPTVIQQREPANKKNNDQFEQRSPVSPVALPVLNSSFEKGPKDLKSLGKKSAHQINSPAVPPAEGLRGSNAKPLCIDVPNDGSCLFHSLAIAIRHSNVGKQFDQDPIWQSVPATEQELLEFSQSGKAAQQGALREVSLWLRNQALDWINNHRGDKKLESTLMSAVTDQLASENPAMNDDAHTLRLQKEVAQLQAQRDQLIYGDAFRAKQQALQRKEVLVGTKEEELMFLTIELDPKINHSEAVKREIEQNQKAHTRISLEIKNLKEEIKRDKAQMNGERKQLQLLREEREKMIEGGGAKTAQDEKIDALFVEIEQLSADISEHRITKYLDLSRNPTFYGGGPQLLALGHLFKVRIDVCEPNKKGQIEADANLYQDKDADDERASEPVRLALIGSHYNFVLMPKPILPKVFIAPAEAEEKVREEREEKVAEKVRKENVFEIKQDNAHPSQVEALPSAAQEKLTAHSPVINHLDDDFAEDEVFNIDESDVSVSIRGVVAKTAVEVVSSSISAAGTAVGAVSSLVSGVFHRWKS